MQTSLRFMLALTVAGLSVRTSAQWGIGPKVGITIAKVRDTKNHIAADSKLGYVAGVSFHTSLSRTFRFEPELLFAQKGYAEKMTIVGFSSTDQAELKVTLDYIEIPLMATLAVGNTSPWLLLQAGPYIGLAVGGKSWTRFSQNGQSFEQSISGSPDELGAETVDAGFNFGGGLSFSLGEGRLNLEARYQMGLSDMAKGSLKNVNRGGMYTLSYVFGWKKVGA